ncbi:hypothetical protein [Occallatibacter riparius]|uniref:Uncharacterized protein n=1 Tax=Occallatibacter riparius TaxID=1002689 RepID=A0A9J7BU48_9BACT|nr:hypothetical protein [Occallatibacter riparius]UWZ85266.1 hypothetical protein MOP44_04825 [Occallatibacter riparius]
MAATLAIDESTDLTALTFRALRDTFFDKNGKAVSYALADKKYVQGDPFDEFVREEVRKRVPKCVEVSKSVDKNGKLKPLTSPDLLVFAPSLCDGVSRASLCNDLSRIVGLEVKKFEVEDHETKKRIRKPPRGSGMDFNSTPPCGTITVYDLTEHPFQVRGFYLFVTQSQIGENQYKIINLLLCDGNLLNEDFEFYSSIVGTRSKKIGLGTYGDGLDRVRPMLVFPNPLRVAELITKPTLVTTASGLEAGGLSFVGRLHRTVVRAPAAEASSTQVNSRIFNCYRTKEDTGSEPPFTLADPFNRAKSSEKTAPRGRFKVNVRLAD